MTRNGFQMEIPTFMIAENRRVSGRLTMSDNESYGATSKSLSYIQCSAGFICWYAASLVPSRRGYLHPKQRLW
jgi:hypothetical protein